jgi:hypothetical protein
MLEAVSTPQLELATLGCGIGLHREHYEELLRGSPPVRWFELRQRIGAEDIMISFAGHGPTPGPQARR